MIFMHAYICKDRVSVCYRVEEACWK